MPDERPNGIPPPMRAEWFRELCLEKDVDGNPAYPEFDQRDWDAAPEGEAVYVAVELESKSDTTRYGGVKPGDKVTFIIPGETIRCGDDTGVVPYHTTLWGELGIEPLKEIDGGSEQWRAYVEMPHYQGPQANVPMAATIGDDETRKALFSKCVETHYDECKKFATALNRSKGKFAELVDGEEYPRKTYFLKALQAMVYITPNEWYKRKRDNTLDQLTEEWKSGLILNVVNEITSGCPELTDISNFKKAMGQDVMNAEFLCSLVDLVAGDCTAVVDDMGPAVGKNGNGRHSLHASSSGLAKEMAGMRDAMEKQVAAISKM